ncbi:MAG: TIGR04282 family arsenosugar biosynthesis glycosyltransferase [Flavobacteriaceae bacterium]
MSHKNLLIVFVKNQVLGHCKTRLAKRIGAEKALEVYRILLDHTHNIALEVPCDKAVFYSQEVISEDLWETDIFKKQGQCEGDLGEKMQAAFQWGFSQGYTKIVLIGSDLIDLTASDITSAFSHLDHCKTVFGPAVDGGYYLIGQASMNRALFHHMPWSTNQVLKKSTEQLAPGTYRLLSYKNDIDTLEDLTEHPIFTPFISHS